MRWPWSKDLPPEPISDDVDDAVQGRRHAEAALERDRARSQEVREVSERSRRHGTVNHFAQLIAETFRG
jgi:hypothetical protein